MTSVNSSRKQFIAMLVESIKKAVIFPILAFICLMFFTISNCSFLNHNYKFDTITPFFWDELRDGSMTTMAAHCFIIAGFINALILFSFVWSKKHTNVIFSLGMKRSDIFLPKIIGGILPMAASLFIAAIIETFSYVSLGCPLNGRFFAMAALTTLQFLAIYTLSFVLSSVVFSNTGNVVEGIIFTAILAAFPMMLEEFFDSAFWGYTLGAAETGFDFQTKADFNWSMPFEAFYHYGGGNDVMDFYFTSNGISLNVCHWSGTIMATVYSAVLCLIGYLAFNRRRNEISGTWGRAKVLTEIVGFALGFYAFYMVAFSIFYGARHGDDGIIRLIGGFVAMMITMIIFRLIFGYKRKKDIKTILKHSPIYAAAIGAVVLVFSLGLFGYSSYIPNKTEIAKITVSFPNQMFAEDYLSESADFGLYRQNNAFSAQQTYYGTFGEKISYSYAYSQNYTGLIFTLPEDINRITSLHEKFISEGKIKDNAEDAVGTYIEFIYTLKDGSTVKRYYSEATEELYKEMLKLNDTVPAQYTLLDYLGYTVHDWEFYINSLFDMRDKDETESDIKEDEYYDYENYEAESYLELCTYQFVNVYHDAVLYSYCKSDFLITENCYLFPTDMSKGYNLGHVDYELLTAIVTDLKNINSDEYYHHSHDDEIGILSFGLSYTHKPDYYWEDSITYESLTVRQVGESYSTSWNLNSSDIKTVLITKDMTNTIKYLEEHDLMKHFEKNLNVNDIKHIKLATMSELYTDTNRSDNLPIFYAAYWEAYMMASWKLMHEEAYVGYYYFDNIQNTITDKYEIQQLLDKSVLYGFCSNKDQIMEITYVDGTTATVLVK